VDQQALSSISPREAEVLAELGEHRSNAQIAHRLHISVRTVETHVAALLRKLGVADRRALAAVAAHRGQPGQHGIAGLPVSRTSFVGREEDRVTAEAALGRARLVSLVGPGGVGKTRLAAAVAEAVAEQYPAGGAFVDLVPVGAGFTIRAVADALDVPDQSSQSLEAGVLGRLSTGRTLLILDNCEHLVDEVAEFVERVLNQCPPATVLATSRERLGLPGEWVLEVAPLPIDGAAEQLFVERARAAGAGVEADTGLVRQICASLDGLPLAIELAAARSASLGPDGLLAALDDRLRLLAGQRTAGERHRSLRGVLDWSYELLDTPEQRLFRRLSVFVGAFNLNAAAAVNPGIDRAALADQLGRLADKSLLVRSHHAGASRWRFLATIRDFGLDRLRADGSLDEVRHRHVKWAASVATELERRLDGDTWSTDFDQVVDDLRTALASTGAKPDATAHRLAQALAHISFARGYLREARAHYRAAADRASDANHDLRRAADAAIADADGAGALGLLVEAAERAYAAGDATAGAAAQCQAVITALRYPGSFAVEVAHDRRAALLREASAVTANDHLAATLATAQAWHEGGAETVADLALSRAALVAAQAADDPILVLGASDALCAALLHEGRMREAHRLAAERLGIAAALPGHDPAAAVEVIDAFQTASSTAIAAGDTHAALDIVQRASTDDPVGQHPYLFAPRLIRALVLTGSFDEAVHEAQVMWDAWQRDGSPRIPWAATAIAAVALVHGVRDDGRFTEWRTRALRLARTTDAARSPNLNSCMAFVDARVAIHTGRLDNADAQIAHAFAPDAEPWWVCYARAVGAELAVIAGRPDASQLLERVDRYAAENDWAAAVLARASGRHTGNQELLRDAVERWERLNARFERACTLRLLPARAQEGLAELRALGCSAGS
jgi:predicted ATPase/DNA-binding CsgD family transcriptional regulator